MNFRFEIRALSEIVIFALTGCELKEPDEKNSLLQEILPQKALI